MTKIDNREERSSGLEVEFMYLEDADSNIEDSSELQKIMRAETLPIIFNYFFFIY